MAKVGEKKCIRLGTRGSKLALAQTRMVADAIRNVCPEAEVELVTLVTKGDRIQGKALVEFGGKGAFVEEFEQAILDGTIDLAVHSAKDMPVELSPGLTIGAVLPRGDARDVLVTVKDRELPDETVTVGTGSPRRQLQIRDWMKAHWDREAECRLLRGNVNTRLEKLWNGEYDAIVLAAAGLFRLSLDSDPRFRFTYFPEAELIPAGGQAIIAVESREGDTLSGILPAINHEPSMQALLAERLVLKRFGAGCNEAIAVYGWEEKEQFHLKLMRETAGGILRREVWGPSGSAMELANQIAGEGGLVSLVGAGPGDPELITEKGRKVLMQAQVLVYDRLASEELVRLAPEDCEKIYAGKESGHHSMNQQEINRLLVKKALEGKRVVRLKGGDSFVFGRGGEEVLALKEAGISYEVIPGITSAIGALESAGIPVTHRGIAESFHVITGHRAEGVLKELPLYAALPGTLVFLMGLSNLEAITKGLIQAGMAPDTPAAVVMEGTLPGELCVRGTLENLSSRVREANVKSPAVIVVGKTAGFSFACRENRPLSGITVAVTGTEGMYEKLSHGLSRAGARTVRAGRLMVTRQNEKELGGAVKDLSSVSWLVFTSRNAISIFFDAMKKERADLRMLSHVKFAVVGRGTAEYLQKFGFYADYMPARYTTEELARGLAERIQKDGIEERKQVLIPRAAQGSSFLSETLTAGRILFREISVYDVQMEPVPEEEFAHADYLTFESGSGVRGFFGEMEKEKRERLLDRIRPVCIGEVTAAALRTYTDRPILTAEEFTAEGIVEAILKDRKGRM